MKDTPGSYSASLSDDYVHSLAFSPDGTTLATADIVNDVKLWNVRTRKLIRTFHQSFGIGDRVAFSPDGKHLVSAGENQNLMVWDVNNGKLVWNAVPIDWEAEKRSELASQKRMAATAAAEAEKRRTSVDADKETSTWRNRVSIVFDHYGEPINPLEQRMMEKGTPNKSLTVQAAAEATGVWLRFRNDSPLHITFSTNSFYLPRKDCGGKPATVAGLCNDAEISIRYGVEESNGKPVPYGLDFFFGSILPPGVSALFSVPKEHLSNGRKVFISFTYLKEGEKEQLVEYGTEHRVTFRSSRLRK